MTYAPNDYALVIGINDYPNWNNGAKSLKGAVRDAEGFHTWLINPKGGGLSPNNAKLILSSKNSIEPRQSLIDDAFGEIRKLSKGKERRRFYFYFSGHGHSRAGSWQQQSLCLANWSPEDAGAALHLESYIKASIGCLKFSEAVFFIDCCRVRAIAPLGKQSDLECGDPDTAGRASAILYGSEQYTPTYEGDVNGEIRGYFTTGLLKILSKGFIELRDLLDELQIIVPQLSNAKDQTVRAVPADRKIFLGPPPQPKPQLPANPITSDTDVQISVLSNLTGLNSREDPEQPPSVGNISILQKGSLISRGLGSLMTKLPSGHYQVQIDHAEALTLHDFEVKDLPVQLDLKLPRRASATLLSSTIDKREQLTGPVIAASQWRTFDDELNQAVFISLRSNDGDIEVTHDMTKGYLRLEYERYDGRGTHAITETNTLLPHLSPGTSLLVYQDYEGPTSRLPIPIAGGWDTHVFILIRDGKPQLATASVSMRPAGLGFDPSDALIDAYELAIADLVTGGPGPDPDTLDNLLWSKYRNPLFGLLGAHFLIRKLRQDGVQNIDDIERLTLVTENLSQLLGNDAPDIIALRIWKQLLMKERPIFQPEPEWRKPLFNVGFQAFIEASAFFGDQLYLDDDTVALGLDANSPWTCWREDREYEISALGTSSLIEFQIQTAASSRVRAIERLWRGKGLDLKASQTGEQWTLSVKTDRNTPHDLFKQAVRILHTPESVVGYVRDAVDQANRKGERLDFTRLVHRTMLPLSVLKTAKLLAEQKTGDDNQQIEMMSL